MNAWTGQTVLDYLTNFEENSKKKVSNALRKDAL